MKTTDLIKDPLNHLSRRRGFFLIPIALLLATTSSGIAGNATRGTNPATGNWSTAGNWTPATVPNGPNDTATFAKYAAAVPGTLAPFSGKYVIRGGKVTAVEGDAPKQRFIVIAFDSVEKAQAWEDSPAYEAIKPIRHASAKSRVFIAEGVAPQ